MQKLNDKTQFDTNIKLLMDKSATKIRAHIDNLINNKHLTSVGNETLNTFYNDIYDGLKMAADKLSCFMKIESVTENDILKMFKNLENGAIKNIDELYLEMENVEKSLLQNQHLD